MGINYKLLAKDIVIFMMLLGVANNATMGQLTTNFYRRSCPNVQTIVRNHMTRVVQSERRMAASILRLFFHDCFVQGCDASVLLDDTPNIQGEKKAVPNNNSLRGFQVIDTIKSNVESTCPGVVSCADILAIASRDAIVLSGGPNWNVLLGRRDSTTSSLTLANKNLPRTTDNVDTLISKFEAQGLSMQDMVILSGGHTIGEARCITFKSRLYNNSGIDPTLNNTYANQLKAICPPSGGDNKLAFLDITTPNLFDNWYFTNLVYGKGLLASDQELYSSDDSPTRDIVEMYSEDAQIFFDDFATSMIKMGNIHPLIGRSGQIRKNCHVVNSVQK